MSFWSMARTNTGVRRDLDPILTSTKPGEIIKVEDLSRLVSTKRRSVTTKTIGRLLFQNDNFESVGHGRWRRKNV